MAAVAVTDPASTYWRSIVYIEATFSSGATLTGSGVMVGPNDVLTASHVLYMPHHGGAATSVRVIPAYQPSPYAAPYGEATSNSFHYFTDYDPDGDGYLMPGDNGPGLGGSELDIGLINLSTPLGHQTGWMELNPGFTTGVVNITGYPTAYGRSMMNNSAYAYTGPVDSTVFYTGAELHAGNSGGPVWIETATGAQVVGVVSTAAWGAAVRGTYDQLRQWISANDYLIAGYGSGAASDGGGTQTPPSVDTSSPAEDLPPAAPPTTAPIVPPLYQTVSTGTRGNDHLMGTAGDDAIDGGPGNDVFYGTAGNDMLIGGTGIDTAVYGARAGYAVAHHRGNVTVRDHATGTVDTLQGIERLQFSDAMMLTTTAPRMWDRDGDGRADLMVRSLESGSLQVGMMNGTQLVPTHSTNLHGGIDWTVVGSGDFNGDGRGDVLWRHDDGLIAIWNMQGTAVGRSDAVASSPAHAEVAGVGDFNGDGRSDILWRTPDGTLSTWQMDGHSIVGGGVLGSMPTDWRVAGTADFNGDQRTDIIFRHDDGAVAILLMDGTSHSGGGIISSPSPDWRIAALGDFDGDGRDDILWRNDNGMTGIWLMNGESIVNGWGTVTGHPGIEWAIVGVGDFNGDGRDDLLWQDIQGTVKVELIDGLSTLATGSPGALGLDWVFV